MTRIIEITQEKGSSLAQMCGEALRANHAAMEANKELMSCIDEIMQGGGQFGERSMGMREGMGMRDGGRYGNRGGYGNRDWEDSYMERRNYR